VNNAGVAMDNPIFNATLEEFDATVNTNLRSTWYLTKRLSRLMIRKKAGRIINITSVVGLAGNPTQSIYGMTKAALDNFTKTAAKEFASYGILVNSVAPGYIGTSMTEKLSDELREEIHNMIPLGRMGKPEEVAEMVEFLASKGSYCTGSIFQVNGGIYA
jgi:3-oxoacyl-[acyl-carrier protein] reductase